MKKSSKRRFLYLFNLMIIVTFLGLIVACGGGGGGGNTDEGGTTATNSSTLTLTVSSNTVTFGTPVTVTATLTDAEGNELPNTVVTFAAADSTLVTFTPTVATALTNDSGVATIMLNAASVDSAGATSITATAPVIFQDATVTTTSAPLGVTVGGATVTLGAVTIGASPISAYGTSSISVPVLIGGAAATVPISVNFTSPCVSSGKASLSTPVTSSAGVATSTYKDNGCAAGTSAINDTITASSGDATTSGTIIVNPTSVNNIEFVSATPEVIKTSTTSETRTAEVKFQVKDSNNQGKSGVGVTFSMLPANYSSFGITFNPATAISDANGYVSTWVSSGTVPTPIWIVATVTSNSAIKSQSNRLAITTGLPAQNFFSLSASTHNIEGWKYNDITTTISIIASDRLGTSVPDGTVINFITEGGNISGGAVSSCSTTNGRCSVTLASADNKPADGRVTILAFAIGEESFLDNNGNNRFDSGDTCYDLGDIYIDANESSSYEMGEYFQAYGSGSSVCPATTFDVPSKANTCTGTCENNYVRRSDVIVFSDSYALVSTDTINQGSHCAYTQSILLTDKHGNAMPAGTTISTKNNSVSWSSRTADIPPVVSTATATLSIGGTPVIDTNGYGTPFSIKVDGGTNCTTLVNTIGTAVNYPSGTFTLLVTTPKGDTTEIPITVTGTKNF